MSAVDTLRVALVGNPNCGKTALSNLLTGSRQKVANYAGVTVERKEGRFLAPSGRSYALLDLPGAYSLHAASLDEAITRDLCRGFYPGEPAPDVIVCVVDATNLRLHLRFALEVRELGRPMVVAVNMMDAAKRRARCVAMARRRWWRCSIALPDRCTNRARSCPCTTAPMRKRCTPKRGGCCRLR
jgi:ferrous iron transport protein B